MNEEKLEMVNPIDKLQVLFAIHREIKKGNVELSEQLKRDALEYLKERNMEYQWLIDMSEKNVFDESSTK